MAVLLIVAYHAGLPGFRGGFIGVDVFFVLSGYLITGLLVKEMITTGKLNIVKFYARRARRILPAAALMLMATIAAALFLLPPLEQKTLSGSAVTTAAYVSNFFFLRQAGDYFGPDSRENPLLHTWSLSVEEQFYLVWPALIMLAFRGARSRRRLAYVIAAVTVISLVACVWLTARRPAWAFYSSPARAWEFGIGALAVLLPALRFPGAGLLGWVGLAAIGAATAGFSSSTIFPGIADLVPVLGTAALLAAGSVTLLETPVLQALGRFSYSWYLWHWPVLTLAEERFPAIGLSTRVLCAVAALGLAVATHYLVENPVRFHPRLLPRPVLSLGLAAGVTVLGVGVSSAWRIGAEHMAQYKLFVKPINDVPRFYQLGCRTEFLEERPRECVFGAADSPVTVVLIGDSHAAQWFPALERVANEKAWRLVTEIKMACPAVFIPVFQTKIGREEAQCSSWRRQVYKRIAAMRPTAVILASSVEYAGVSPAQWRDGTRLALQLLRVAGARAIILRDTPKAEFNVPLCLARAAWRGSGNCALARAEALDETVYAAEREAAETVNGVGIADLSDQICGPSVCDPVQGGKIIFRDRDHLSASYVESLAPALEQQLTPLVR